MKTAIIDNELDRGTYNKYFELTTYLTVKNGKIKNFDETVLLEYTSHGGECLKHFEIGSQTAADCFILLKYDEDNRCNVNDLIVALEWCIDNGVSIISLSMGTRQYSDAELFGEVMMRMGDADICLIAGSSNDKHLSFPACLSGAIGVCVDYTYGTVKNRFAYIEDSFDGIEVVLNPNILVSDVIDSNSMATAYFSGLVAKAISDRETKPGDVRTWIAENASKISKDQLHNYTLNAIVFDVAEDIVVVGVEGLMSDPYVLGFFRKLQDIFLSNEYLCLTVIPKCGINRTSDFALHEFVQPISPECPYTDYIELIKSYASRT